MENEMNIYSLNLICYLRLHGFEEIDVGFNRNTNKVFFIYDDNDALKSVIEEYRDRDVEVRLHDFIGEFKKLKSQMYQYSRDFEK